MALTLTPETESRILAEATRRNQPPEAVINAALEALLQTEPLPDAPVEVVAETQEERQARLRRLLLAATEEAKLVEPAAYDSPVRTYYRESEVGEIIAEKFRKRGFNVD